MGMVVVLLVAIACVAYVIVPGRAIESLLGAAHGAGAAVSYSDALLLRSKYFFRTYAPQVRSGFADSVCVVEYCHQETGEVDGVFVYRGEKRFYRSAVYSDSVEWTQEELLDRDLVQCFLNSLAGKQVDALCLSGVAHSAAVVIASDVDTTILLHKN